jgi:hypothetical protein
MAFADALRGDPPLDPPLLGSRLPETLESDEIVLEPFVGRDWVEWFVKLGRDNWLDWQPMETAEEDAERLHWWELTARALTRLWSDGRGQAWGICTPAQVGAIWVSKADPYGVMTGVRIPDLTTADQEVRVLRLLAQFVRERMGLYPVLSVCEGEYQALHCARIAGVSVIEVPLPSSQSDIVRTREAILAGLSG